MSSTTTMVAAQFRLQEWVKQVKACQSWPEGMTVHDWCRQNGISKADYYYRLRRVRQACLDSIPEDNSLPVIVPVPAALIDSKPVPQPPVQGGLDISVNGISIHVTEAASPALLSAVLEVVLRVK